MSQLSYHAQRALERLHESSAFNWFIRSDLARNDANCPGPEGINIRFNQSLEYYLSAQQVIHAADTLNSYCQSILAEVLKASPQIWEKVASKLNEGKDREKAILKLENHRGKDGCVRKALVECVESYWAREADVIVNLRNKFVHQNGHDPDREVEKIIQSEDVPWCDLPPTELPDDSIPVGYGADNWLEADAKLGYWACLHIRTHIHFMDQNLCHEYQLPRDRWRPRPVSRHIAASISGNTIVGVTPGQSLTTMKNTPLHNPKAENMTSNIKEDDIVCSKTWKKWSDVLISDVKAYIDSIELKIKGSDGGLVGTILTHTLSGQERHYEWSLLPPEPQGRKKPETVCVRFREKGLTPFMTIWGTNSVMRDFQEGKEDAAIEYLKDCIDKTLTVNR